MKTILKQANFMHYSAGDFVFCADEFAKKV